MPNTKNMYGGEGEEDADMKVEFVKVMVGLSEQCVNFINAAQKIVICLSNMTVEQYVKATTFLKQWKQVNEVNEEINNIFEKLKNENISLKFDLSILQNYISHVSELQHQVEKMFVDKSPEEVEIDK